MQLPMQLTILRIALAVVFLVLFAFVEPPNTSWAVLLFIIAAVTDWWDGHIARRMKLESELGAFLDPLADKLLTGAAFVSFALKGLVAWWMVIIILFRDVYMTVLRAAADGAGLPIHTSRIAKIKTFVQMLFLGAMLARIVRVEGPHDGAFLHSLAVLLAPLADLILLVVPMWGVTLLTAITAIGYTFDNWQTLTRLLSGRTTNDPAQ